MKPQKNSVIVVLIVILIIVFAYFSMQKPTSLDKKDIDINVVRINPLIPELPSNISVTAPTPIKQLITPQQPRPAVTAPASSAEQTIEYSTSVTYDVPGDSQSLSVKLTLQNNIVINVSTSLSMSGGESSGYQKRFASSYKSQVLNKNIKDISLSRVGGASLTTEAFNQAIAKIKNSL
jgi:hypothetical protein